MKTLKRIFFYVIIPLVAIIFIVIIYISIVFGKMEFEDNFLVESDYTLYYPDSYETARDSIRIFSGRIAEKFKGVSYHEIPVISDIDNDLTVGVCYIPAQNESTNLLIISSGVHGVEGYVGHAAQMFFVDRYLTDDLVKNTGILLIHSVNPFGFKHGRRVTENNVDINRNSSLSDQLYTTINEDYPKVYNLINPKGRVSTSSLDNRFFFLKAVNEIRKASLPVLRQAVLQGQYQFPEGLYFGGDKKEPQIDSLRPIIEQVALPYQKIMVIDFHTGYGERGKLHLFPNPLEGEKRAKLEALYEGFQIDWGDSDDFYTITGDFSGFIGDIVGDKEFYPMVFEYGTLNSQTTLGSMKSIHVMIMENQGQHYGFASRNDSIKVKRNLYEMYYSSSVNWQNYILDQTNHVFSTVIPRFGNFQN